MATVNILASGARTARITETSGNISNDSLYSPFRIDNMWERGAGNVPTDFRWLSLVFDFANNIQLKTIPRNNITGISFSGQMLNWNNANYAANNDRHPVIVTPLQRPSGAIPSYGSLVSTGQSTAVTSQSMTTVNYNFNSRLSELVTLAQANNLSFVVTAGKANQAYTDADFNRIDNGFLAPPYSVYFNVSLSPSIAITYNVLKPNSPIALVPDGASRNPLEPIILSWYFNPQIVQGLTPDTQKGAEVKYNLNGGTWTTKTITGSNPSYTLIIPRLVDDDIIEWQVRAEGAVHGWSDWSSVASFDIAPTPPLPPLLNYPLSSLNASGGILFEWTYRSDVDVIPTGFDFAYKLDNADWIETHIPGSLDTPANSFYFLDVSIVEETPFSWKVRSYGELRSVSDWSDTISFNTIGAPPPPTIINISEISRPTIFFNASSLISFEIEVLQAGEIVYSSGIIGFESVFNYRLNIFLSNGQYLVRLRVVNTFGYTSQWALRSLYINVPTITGTNIRNVSRMPYSIRLYLDDIVSGYVYRNNLRIAEINSNVFDDFTCAPDVVYEYFIRSFDTESFADSNIVKAETSFNETLIADVESLTSMIKLSGMLNSKPKKTSNFKIEKAVLSFVGRISPVVEMADTEFRQFDYTFYVNKDIKELLEQYHKSQNTLLLRDKRFGSIYGVISTPIDATAVQKGFTASFSFLETDYQKEVNL